MCSCVLFDAERWPFRRTATHGVDGPCEAVGDLGGCELVRRVRGGADVADLDLAAVECVIYEPELNADVPCGGGSSFSCGPVLGPPLPPVFDEPGLTTRSVVWSSSSSANARKRQVRTTRVFCCAYTCTAPTPWPRAGPRYLMTTPFDAKRPWWLLSSAATLA